MCWLWTDSPRSRRPGPWASGGSLCCAPHSSACAPASTAWAPRSESTPDALRLHTHEEMPPGGPRVCVACRHILFGLWGCFFKKIFLFGPTSKIKHLIKSGLPTSLGKYQNLASGDHSNKPCGGACQHLGHPGIQPLPWSCGLGPYTAVTLCPRLQKGPTSLSAKPPKLRRLP